MGQMKNQNLHKGEKKFSPAQFLALSFLAAILVGTGLFLLPFSTKAGHMSLIDALFLFIHLGKGQPLGRGIKTSTFGVIFAFLKSKITARDYTPLEHGGQNCDHTHDVQRADRPTHAL